MLYNIPGRTGVNMSVETMVRLSKLDNIVAIKESSGDLDQITQLVAAIDESIVVYSGDDYLLLPILSVGGKGVVSVASHLVGDQIKRLSKCFKMGMYAKQFVSINSFTPSLKDCLSRAILFPKVRAIANQSVNRL